MIQFIKKKPRKLDLSGRNLSEFPAEVFMDKKTSSIDLSNNHIEEIPAKIAELTELRHLHLENNSITQLHNGILKAKSLRNLYLQGNPIKHLPNFIKEDATFTIFTDTEVHRYFSEIIIDGGNRTLYKELGDEVDSIKSHATIFNDSSRVPTVMDNDLTFCRDYDRTGRSLNTCVLFVDIRNSVQKNKEHRVTTLADMYSSFVYGVLRITKEFKGHVRNIIGDRIMVVFDEDNCCNNAVKCAGTIIYFCKTQMKRVLPNDIFKCGIGIHFGSINVIKVGLKVPNNENADYKNLIWIGDPANMASRLTDMAGKESLPCVIISKDVYKKLTEDSLRRNFVPINKRVFKDVDFNVLGCNLLIK